MLILVIVAALLFDFMNGWNDSANAIATVVSTRVMTPIVAVIFASGLNFLGALGHERVAKMIGGGLVDSSLLMGHQYVVLAAMLAAAGWVYVCTMRGLPISGSHSLIGGLLGATAGAFGLEVVKSAGIINVIAALILSPVLGFILGYILLIAVYWIAYFMRPRTVRKTFGSLQIFSSGFMAYTHGMNDAQKVMGVIALALVLGGQLGTTADGAPAYIPLWVKLTCATVMGLGTALGGWRVIRTLGMKLAHIRPIEGFAAETAAGLVLTLKAGLGLPVSTTHTVAGSIMGVGTANSAKSVQWSIGKKMMYAWVLTLPAAAILGALMALILKFFLG